MLLERAGFLCPWTKSGIPIFCPSYRPPSSRGDVLGKELLVLTKWFPSEGTVFASPFVYYLTTELARYFDRVTVVSLNPKIPSILRKRAILHRLGYDRRWHQDLYSPGYFRDYSFSNIRVRYVHYSDLRSRGSPEKEAERALERVLKIVEKERISADLIHAHFLFPAGYIGALLKKRLGIPLVVSAHGSDVYAAPFRDGKSMELARNTVSSADHILTPSRRNERILVRDLGGARIRVSVIPNGYDDSIFHPYDMSGARKKLGIPDNKRILVSVGNLIPVKGYDIFLDAMPEILRRFPDTEAYIVGSGSMGKELEKRAESLGISEAVHFTGNRPHHEIPLWMSAGDLFFISSRDEGNPTVLFEAWACGSPVVSTSVGGVPDVMEEDMGILVDPEKASELSDGICRALSTEWDREIIAEKARRFSWKNIAKRTYSMMSGVIHQ